MNPRLDSFSAPTSDVSHKRVSHNFSYRRKDIYLDTASTILLHFLQLVRCLPQLFPHFLTITKVREISTYISKQEYIISKYLQFLLANYPINAMYFRLGFIFAIFTHRKPQKGNIKILVTCLFKHKYRVVTKK